MYALGRALVALVTSAALGVAITPSAAFAGENLGYERIVINPSGGSYPGADAATIGDRLYIWASGSLNERRLWAVDGADAVEVAPDHEFAGGSRAVVFGERLLFQANAPGVGIAEKHIWESDGANLRDLGDNGASGLGGILELAGLLYEGDYDGLFVYDGASFEQLSAEHVRDTDLRVAPDGQTLVYVTDEAVRTYDGEAFTTIYAGNSPQFPMVTSSHVFFHDSGVLYAYDWVTQTMSSTYVGNTNAGVSTPYGVYLAVEGIASYCTPGSCDPVTGPASGAWLFTQAGSHVYFRAPDASGQAQLWAVRNGESNAAPVQINPDAGSDPFVLRSYNGHLFLRADGGDGTGLWQVDGTSARFLANPRQDDDSDPIPLGATTDSVFFSASDGAVRDLFVVHPFPASAASVGQVQLTLNPIPVSGTTTLQAQIDGPATQVEYFVGDDPGQGQGTPMQVQGSTASANLQGFSGAGVYEVDVRASDEVGVWSDTLRTLLVVYDPSAGFATGGGWLVPGSASSDVGDVLPGLDGTSKANFGFVVKYQSGASTVPGGNLQFQYKAGDFRLKSIGMEWLVVTNSNWAKFQGMGQVDGLAGLVPFRVDARDSSKEGDPDRFIIRIWAPGADPDTTDALFKASGDVDGGQVVIHKD